MLYYLDLVMSSGTPIVGGPKHTPVAPMVQRNHRDLETLEQEIMRRNDLGRGVPRTSLYSKLEGSVPRTNQRVLKHDGARQSGTPDALVAWHTLLTIARDK